MRKVLFAALALASQCALAGMPAGEWRADVSCSAAGAGWSKARATLDGKGALLGSVSGKADGRPFGPAPRRPGEMTWMAPEKMALLAAQMAGEAADGDEAARAAGAGLSKGGAQVSASVLEDGRTRVSVKEGAFSAKCDAKLKDHGGRRGMKASHGQEKKAASQGSGLGH